MKLESEPRIGTWYAGECATGFFLMIGRDADAGLIHLRSADGRRVRMTLEKWSRHPLRPARNVHRQDHFEWDEPVIG